MVGVSGIVLAAGPSQRMGGRAKPLLRLAGRPLVQRLVGEAAASRLTDLYVVTGYRSELVATALAGLPVSVVENPAWEEGQSSSVRAGLAALRPDAEAAMFIPVDQPLLTAAVIDRLIEAWERTRGPIVAPTHEGRRGAPVIFDRALFAELGAIRGDAGGRQLFDRHPESVVEVAVDEAAPLADVDTPEDLQRLDGAPERFALEAPRTRDQIIAALRALRAEISSYCGALRTEELLAPQGEFWSPADHLRHLARSISPITRALRWPRPVLAALIGTSRSGSRTFEEMVARYRQALADGGQAGRFAPSRPKKLVAPDKWRLRVLAGFERAGRDLEEEVAGWSERALDRYRLPHPLLGKLTVREMLFFTLYHNAHHARRIVERASRHG